jgi:hypothetical protein
MRNELAPALAAMRARFQRRLELKTTGALLRRRVTYRGAPSACGRHLSRRSNHDFSKRKRKLRPAPTLARRLLMQAVPGRGGAPLVYSSPFVPSPFRDLIRFPWLISIWLATESGLVAAPLTVPRRGPKKWHSARPHFFHARQKTHSVVARAWNEGAGGASSWSTSRAFSKYKNLRSSPVFRSL